MSKRRKLCLASIIAETAGTDRRPKLSLAAPAPQRCRRDGPADGSWPALTDAVRAAPKINAVTYADEMMRLEGQRNAACRQGDAGTLRDLAERRAWLNYRFWGRQLN
jgi:hypothetical protein